MKDVYVDKFYQLLAEFDLEPTTHIYLAGLLASHVERTDFFQTPVALRAMQLETHHSAKDLGDNCLVIVGFFSGYRSMSDRYYAQIGSGSYQVAANYTGSQTLARLADEFDHLGAMLQEIRPPVFFK